MENFNEIIKEFRNDQFKKNYKVGEAKLSIENEVHVMYAICKAYADMTPRTIKNIKDAPKSYICPKGKKEVFEWLRSEMMSFMKAHKNTCISYDDFNKWHMEICRHFVNEFNDKALVEKQPIGFGKAQKIINMLFKYLRCFDDAQEYLNCFSQCHMAIDSYIINWYNENMSGEKIVVSWSNLDETHYYSIQENIKKLLSNPFEEEFPIWMSEKKKAIKNQNNKNTHTNRHSVAE